MRGIINWTTTLLFIVGVIIIAIKMKDDDEPYYALKIVGYYLLGGFRLFFNKLYIPIGFVIFLLFLRNPGKNQRAKRYAASLGLLAFIVSLMIPAIVESYYERPRYVEAITTNIYELNFQNHWKEVAETLGLDEHSIRTARVENLKIDYEKDGGLKELRYEVIWKEGGQFMHAQIYLHEGERKFEIRVTKVDQWLQYDRLINAERLFEKLDQINIKDLTPEGEFLYYGFVFGGWDNFAIKDGEIFIIENSKIMPYTGELPVKGYWMTTFGIKQTGEDSYSSTDHYYYLFDIQRS
ncbi:MAG TPA: hypothetical protein VIK77_08445 [Tissierellaceae bacterium]